MSGVKKHLSTPLLVTTCYTPDIPPYIILLGYHFYIFLNPLHLFSPLWWQRCSFNLQACRETKQARSTCVVANLLGMQGTENLVWANDLLKGDQDTANMIWSMSHQKISVEKHKIQRPQLSDLAQIPDHFNKVSKTKIFGQTPDPLFKVRTP